MVNNKDLINLINNKKPAELVQELEKYEIKKSPLSVAARGKVINKSGSDYVSENKGDCGPCSYSGCPYSNRFYLQMRFDSEKWVFAELFEKKWGDSKEGGRHFEWIEMENVEEARNVLRKFQKGKYRVDYRHNREAWGRPTFGRGSGEKKREVMIKLEDYIDSHERGNKVYEPLLRIYGEPSSSEDDRGPCSQS